MEITVTIKQASAPTILLIDCTCSHRGSKVDHPQPYDRQRYQGLYQDLHGSEEEPHTTYIQHLAEHGLGRLGPHGRMAAMGVPRDQLPG